MPQVTANVTAEEQRQLGVLAFVYQQKNKRRSIRDLAGQGVRMLLKRHKNAIAAVDRMHKMLPP